MLSNGMKTSFSFETVLSHYPKNAEQWYWLLNYHFPFN
uniref:Uncharacterized protein n=1 Tax=Setaria italica TaxID=4555 RepID=K3Z1H8_SETIT